VSADGVLTLDPVLTYALTINGITDQIDVSGVTFFGILNSHEFRLGAQSYTGAASVTVTEVADGASFGDLDAPVSFTDTVNGLGSPFVGRIQKDRSVVQPLYYAYFDTEQLDFRVDVVASGAPEPATWAMMLAGFFGLGAAMRLRKFAPSRPA
jgi:hypothetical protein